MDAQVFSVFVQELVKEAVTVDDLYRKATSAEGVDTDPKGFAKSVTHAHAGSLAKPTTRQLGPFLEQSPKNINIGKLQDLLRRVPIQAARDWAAKLEEMKEVASDVPKEIRGKIVINPDGVNTVFSAGAGKPKLQTPEAQKALTALLASHELAERRVAPQNIRRFSTHLAPEVLLKERNALARLEGPGAREAVDVLAGFRNESGEAQYLRNLLTRTYGPRAAQFLEGDQKVPKAMLRNLRKQVQKNPAILDDAKVGKSMGIMDQIREMKKHRKYQLRVVDAINSLY